MTTFHLTKGDLTRTVSVDAIVTLINSGKAWFGGIDGAIQRVAGGMYHAQAAEMRLRNKQVVIAKGDRSMHRGNFDDVIFVVDDLQSPLNELVSAALKAAQNAGYQSIAFPMMRTGVMMGAVEPNVRAVVAQMRQAFEAFSVDMDVYVVVYDDPEAVKLLAQNMNLLES
ncbi:hypothetical protein DYH11_01120 [Candidatus Microgenomates bacterium CPR3]|nr:hypothetical protein [Candidatus Microgenomates bacterium CPR3]